VALANLLVRDALFTSEVLDEATNLELRVIEVDGSLSVDELTSRVGECLGFADV
jgi:hypothetical protein